LLFEKLTTLDELSGLLNKALTGLKQLIDEGGFHDKDIEDIRKDCEEHTNDVNTFLYSFSIGGIGTHLKSFSVYFVPVVYRYMKTILHIQKSCSDKLFWDMIFFIQRIDDIGSAAIRKDSICLIGLRLFRFFSIGLAMMLPHSVHDPS
jgi:hypothetical protein